MGLLLIREYEGTETRMDCTMILMREEEEDPRASVQVLGSAERMLQKKGKSFLHKTVLLFTLPSNQDYINNSNELSVFKSSNL